MRPKPPQQEGPITKALHEAVALRKALIADGTPEHEANQIVGQGLKALLANPREAPWKFYCDLCRDTGWISVVLTADEIARHTTMYGAADQVQDTVAPCGQYCRWTQMEREKRRKKAGEEGGDDDFASAGMTKKPTRKFAKFGG